MRRVLRRAAIEPRIAEWLDEETAMAFVFRLGMADNVRMETLRAYDEATMQRILAKVL